MLENKNRFDVTARTIYQDRLLAMLRQYYANPKDPFTLNLLAEWLDENHVNPGYGNICRERIELEELEGQFPILVQSFYSEEEGSQMYSECPRMGELRANGHQFYTLMQFLKAECEGTGFNDPEPADFNEPEFQEDVPTT